ncbi:MAG: peptide deformylase [Armatimonadota bacterium]|nr:peptide deformylase [Armatimonadota bacterium]
MAVRRIVYCGHPALRRRAKRVKRIDDDIIELARDLRETMLEAGGLGLAAAQLGESLAVVTVLRDPGENDVVELINPRIVEQEGEQEGSEGCLSLPTLRGTVIRPEHIVVKAADISGEEVTVEGRNLMARCLAHELDHVEGMLFTDRAEPDTLCWIRPDDSEESGYRTEPTTLEEAEEAFERLRRQRGES